MKKHIVCFGDSNTHGACKDPSDSADHGSRFNENERWTCLLQKKLGEDYLVLEEGLSGRNCAFEDPIHEGMSGVAHISPILMSHEPVDLLIIMLGTNDTKAYFSATPVNIAGAMGEEGGQDAQKMSKGIPQVRIDFYDTGEHVYFGEFTFSHWGGTKPFEPEKWDRIFGDCIKLPPITHE